MTHFEKADDESIENIIAFGEDLSLIIEQFLDVNDATTTEVANLRTGNGEEFVSHGSKYELDDIELGIAQAILSENGLTAPDSVRLAIITNYRVSGINQTTLLSLNESTQTGSNQSPSETIIRSEYFVATNIDVDGAKTVVTKELNVIGGNSFSNSVDAYMSRPDDLSLDNTELQTGNPKIDAFFRGLEINAQMQEMRASEPSVIERRALMVMMSTLYNYRTKE